MAGRLTRWFEDRIRELRRPARSEFAVAHDAPQGDDGARLLELEGLRDEARRLEEAAATLDLGQDGDGIQDGQDEQHGEPACLAKVREALRVDRKPVMRGALRAVIAEFGEGEA